VFFRATVREAADAAGVAGWAANRADGAVEVVLEGTREAVESVVAVCRTGPAGARVDGVRIDDEAPEGLTGFRTR
jgi:acylphosphatase